MDFAIRNLSNKFMGKRNRISFVVVKRAGNLKTQCRVLRACRNHKVRNGVKYVLPRERREADKSRSNNNNNNNKNNKDNNNNKL